MTWLTWGFSWLLHDINEVNSWVPKSSCKKNTFLTKNIQTLKPENPWKKQLLEDLPTTYIKHHSKLNLNIPTGIVLLEETVSSRGSGSSRFFLGADTNSLAPVPHGVTVNFPGPQ